jgi:hypothetical protein
MLNGRQLTFNKLQEKNLQGKKLLKWKMLIKLIFTAKKKQKKMKKVNKFTICSRNWKTLS